jgi:hypothetical protein
MFKMENKKMTLLDRISQHLTWLLRQIDDPELKYAAVNVIGEHEIEIIADNTYFIQIKEPNKIETVYEILDELVPIVARIREREE